MKEKLNKNIVRINELENKCKFLESLVKFFESELNFIDVSNKVGIADVHIDVDIKY